MTTTTRIGSTFSAANGSTYNGCTVGGGFDCELLVTGQSRTDGDTLAIACITEVSSGSEWMISLRYPAGANLQRAAVLLASNPPFDDPEMAIDSSEEWDGLAERWDAVRASKIEVTRYTQDGATYICAGDRSTDEAAARSAAEAKLRTGESLADDMDRVDGCCTWTVEVRS